MPNWGRLSQFFEADDGRLSMSRLLMFLAFFPASWVVYRYPEQLPTYMGITMLQYVGGGAVKGLAKPSSLIQNAEKATVNVTNPGA